MDLGTNISPAEIIKKDIYSGLNDKFYKDSWK